MHPYCGYEIVDSLACLIRSHYIAFKIAEIVVSVSLLHQCTTGRLLNLLKYIYQHWEQ